MSHSILPGDPSLDAIVQEVLVSTGYRPDPSHTAAIKRAIRVHLRRGAALPELLERAVAREPELMRSLLKAVSVPETYFFRQPEHFEWVVDEGLERFGRRSIVRAWSAGCATGEEAYSLAASLLSRAPANCKVDVLGTDILGHSLDIAREATYGTWSQRLAGPILFPVCGPMNGRHTKVLDEVRAVVRFEIHNLLDPPPGVFDVVFCRNVLLYFSTEGVRAVLGRIVEALAPGGVVAFGTLDVSGVPDGLSRLGRTELNMFRRETDERPKAPVRRATVRPPRRASTIPPALTSEVAARLTPEVAMHLRVLASVEQGDRRGAEQELSLLRGKAPDYLPGLFELALFLVRHGERERAVAPMRDLLARLEPLPDGEMLPGPEHLPVSYYRTAARAFLSAAAAGSSPQVSEVES